MKVTASDADDPTYGNSARVVYSVEGQKFFKVDKDTGKDDQIFPTADCLFLFLCCLLFLNIICSLMHRTQILTHIFDQNIMSVNINQHYHFIAKQICFILMSLVVSKSLLFLIPFLWNLFQQCC